MAIAYGSKLISATTNTAGPNQSTWTTGSLSNGASVGDLVVVNFGTTSATSSTSLTLSDSSSNTWTVTRGKATSGYYFAQAYCILTTALTTSSTFTVGGLGTSSNNRIGLIAASFTGVSAVDVDSTWSNSSSTATLTANSDLMVVGCFTSGGATTDIVPATSFTEVDEIIPATSGTIINLEMAYYINAFSAGSYTYTPTYNNDGGSVYRRTHFYTFTETTATNITVNEGNPPNVTVGGNTNITITAEINVSNTATVTNVAIAGVAATVAAGTQTIVNSGTPPNISISGVASTVSAIQNIEVLQTITNIAIAGQSSTITAENNAIINAEVTNISNHNEQPNIYTQQFTEIAANESNITVGGNTNVLELYTSLVLKHDPYNYFKGDKYFTSQGSLTNEQYYGLRKNSGSNPATAKHLSIFTYNSDAKSTGYGISGDPINLGLRFVGTVNGVSSNDIGQFNLTASEIFPLGDNLTYEFWIKTSSTDFIIFSADKTNSSGYRNSSFIGFYQGRLTIGWFNSFGSPYQFVNTSQYLADNSWHHIVFTKEKTGTSTFQYKSYIDGEESSALLSLSVFLDYVASDNNRGRWFSLANDTGNDSALYNYDVVIDEVAMYKKALTKLEIQEHTKSGVGYTGITVNAEKTNIAVDAKDIGLGTQINTDHANINVNAPGASISTDGTTLIITTVSNTDIDGKDFTTANDSSVSIAVQKHDTSISGRNVQISIGQLSFKFISAQDLALGAKDAVAIESLQFGGMLYNQVKKLLFRIGNTGDYSCKFNISVTSNESGLIPAISLSKDNQTFSNSITIESVHANDITDIIWVKFDVNQLDVLGPGTFLINVEQLND